MKVITKVAAIALLLGLAACDAEPRKNLGANFSNAVRHNMAVHVINPEASQKVPEVEPSDGTRAADAVERYKKGETTETEAVVTTGD